MTRQIRATPAPTHGTPPPVKLIIDSFDAGSLWQAIERTVGQDSYESVNSIIVTGKMDAYDLGAVRNLPQLTIVDFSRTSGYNYVPSWIFQDCKALTKVMLPASISEIQYYAFYNCTNLSEPCDVCGNAPIRG